jgi:hypothetical protein
MYYSKVPTHSSLIKSEKSMLNTIHFWLAYAMTGDNQPLVTDEPDEFEIKPVEVHNFWKNTHHFRGIYRIYLKLIKKTQKITTCNRLNLDTLGFGLIMPQKSPGTLGLSNHFGSQRHKSLH